MASQIYSILIGNRKWMTRNGLEVADEVNKAMEEHEVQGQTAVLCAIDGNCILWNLMKEITFVQVILMF